MPFKVELFLVMFLHERTTNLSTQFVQKDALEDCNIDGKMIIMSLTMPIFLGFLLLKRIKIHHYTADAVNFVKIIVNLKNWSSSQQVTGKQRVSNIYTPAGLGGGGVLGLIFARYMRLALQSPCPIIVYSVANI